MMYAEGCYKFGCYAEAAAECSEIITSSSEDKQLRNQAKLLKGKALFFSYQRKIMYLMEKDSLLNKEEQKRLIEECFESTKEVIYLLGGALDEIYIDEEGSRLLDWSMMDCIRETNQLNICKRCFLCRRHDQSLCKSHIFPKFQLSQAEDSLFNRENQEKIRQHFIFGLDKYQMKSAGECWMWLCCKRCECIMTQNAENEFSLHFPSSGRVEYGSWLFNYCCTVLFRTLSLVKFPSSFNDDEVYEALLSCRKHLLYLPAKTSPHDAKVSEAESNQLQLLAQAVTKEIEPFLFVFPSESKRTAENLGLVSCPYIASYRLIDGHMGLAGQFHFFSSYCNGISIFLQFRPSSQCVLPRRCCISPQSGSYCIPEAEEATELIPKGLWMLHHSNKLQSLKCLTTMLQQIAPRAAEKMISKGLLKNIVEHLKFSQQVCQSDLTEETTATATQVLIPDKEPKSSSQDQETTATATQVLIPDKEPKSNSQDQENTATATQVLIPDKEPKSSSQDQETTTTATQEPIPDEKPKSSSQDHVHPELPLRMHHDKPQFSMLPPNFMIFQKGPDTQIKLPQGHQIVLHKVKDLCDLAIFLVLENNSQLYVIYLLDSDTAYTYIDGAFLTQVDKDICFKTFLLENSLCALVRAQLKEVRMQDCVKALVKNLLSKHGFLSLDMLIGHYCLSNKVGRIFKGLSVGLKCSPEGCWYCGRLCHCCMEPASGLLIEESENSRYRFCSQKCKTIFCVDPSQMPQHIFVIDHRDEFLLGNFKGSSVLEVINIYKEENDHYNTTEFLGFCLGGGSDGLLLEHLYIHWQVQSMNSQLYMSFRVTDECVPLEILWCQSCEKEEVMSLFESILKRESKLSRLIEIAMSDLGCENIATYLENFKT